MAIWARRFFILHPLQYRNMKFGRRLREYVAQSGAEDAPLFVDYGRLKACIRSSRSEQAEAEAVQQAQFRLLMMAEVWHYNDRTPSHSPFCSWRG